MPGWAVAPHQAATALGPFAIPAAPQQAASAFGYNPAFSMFRGQAAAPNAFEVAPRRDPGNLLHLHHEGWEYVHNQMDPVAGHTHFKVVLRRRT